MHNPRKLRWWLNQPQLEKYVQAKSDHLGVNKQIVWNFETSTSYNLGAKYPKMTPDLKDRLYIFFGWYLCSFSGWQYKQKPCSLYSLVMISQFYGTWQHKTTHSSRTKAIYTWWRMVYTANWVTIWYLPPILRSKYTCLLANRSQLGYIAALHPH